MFYFFFFSKKYFGIFRKNREKWVKKVEKSLFAKKKSEKNGKMDSLQKALNLIFAKKMADQRLFFSFFKYMSFLV